MTDATSGSRSPRLDHESAAALVRAAGVGDQSAWDALVQQYAGMIWAITRSYRLTSAEGADVSQTTWLRLCENIERLRDPGSVGAWLATTSRRECQHIASRRRALVLVDDVAQLEQDADVLIGAPDEALLRDEIVSEVRQALAQLPDRTQALMTLLMQDDPPSYEEVAQRLGVPIGSIGPTRGRALRRMRRVMKSASEVPVGA